MEGLELTEGLPDQPLLWARAYNLLGAQGIPDPRTGDWGWNGYPGDCVDHRLKKNGFEYREKKQKLIGI